MARRQHAQRCAHAAAGAAAASRKCGLPWDRTLDRTRRRQYQHLPCTRPGAHGSAQPVSQGRQSPRRQQDGSGQHQGKAGVALRRRGKSAGSGRRQRVRSAHHDSVCEGRRMTNHPQALKVVIADDETPARSRVRDLLEDCASSFPIELVGEAASGRELLALLDNSPADVVLLDIRMPEMDGLEAAQHLLKYPEPPSVIFTTAYNDYALKAFELHAIDYLVQPIRLRRLHDALTRERAITPRRLDVLRRIAPEPRKQLSAQEDDKVMLVAVSDIRYLRAELKYVTVRTAAREYLVEDSLSRLEQEFADQYVRIHRSCLVAKAHIVGFWKDSLDAGESRWTVMLNGLEEELQGARRD